MGVSTLDLAKVGPCPSCGAPTRRLASTPIKGSGLDASPADVAHCDACIDNTMRAALDAAGLTSGQPPILQGAR